MAVDSFQPSSALGFLKMSPFFAPVEGVRKKKTSQDPVLPLFLLKTEPIVTGRVGLSGTKTAAMVS